MTTMKPVSVAVLTTSRADFGHIVWPVKSMQKHPGITPFVIAMGAHLSPEYGHTLSDIREHGIEVEETLESLLSSDSDLGMAKTIGLSVLGLSDILGRRRPDLLLVIADRYEMLAAAAAAMAMRIPIGHVEGGEISEGAIDDAVRNALTKLSHLHFAPHQGAADRIIAMGEEPWRVHVTGAPSLDHLRHRQLLSREELQHQIGLELRSQSTLISYHPVTLLNDTVAEADALYKALDQIEGQKIFCFPNCDAGSHQLVDRATAFCASHSDSHLFVNLDHWLYWNLLHHTGVILGNSSSALMEAPSVPLPAVNIGYRQHGRLMAANVIACEADGDEILTAWQRALTPKFRDKLTNMRNPYGDGHASDRICEVIAGHYDRDKLLSKQSRDIVIKDSVIGFNRTA